MAEDETGTPSRDLDVELTRPPAQPPARSAVRSVASWRWWENEGLQHLVTASMPLLISCALFPLAGPARWWLLLAGFVQTVALGMGRRRPLPALVVVVAIDAVAVVAGQAAFGIASVLAAYYVAAWGGRRARPVALAIGLAYAVVFVVVLGPLAIPSAVVTVVAYVGLWATGRFDAGQRDRILELSSRSDRLVRERAAAERDAADRERALLARELHDILNHTVTRIVLTAEAGTETGTDAEARQTLTQVAGTGRDALAELRRLLGVLRTDQLADLRPPPTLGEVDELIRGLPPGGPRVRLERHGTVRTADASVELAAYRVVQESLTNIVRHAGAVPAAVRLDYRGETLGVEVSNDAGRGPGPGRPGTRPGAGTGLIGLRERVELVGGRFGAGWSRGRFVVRADLPLRAPQGRGGRRQPGPGGAGVTATVRVLVCDDEELLREALAKLVAVAPDLEVVATAGDGRAALEAVDRHHPDVVLMDIRMPVLDGIEATRAVVAAHPGTRVLILTTYDLDSYLYAALQAGASGFLLKDAPSERLRDGVRIVAAGNSVLAPEATRRMIEALQPDLPGDEDLVRLAAVRALTGREREIFGLVAAGLSNQQIADELVISRYTVKVHVSSLLAKLGLPDRVQAVLLHHRLRGRW